MSTVAGGGARRILPSGEHAVLVECEDADEVLGLHAALTASRPDGVVDLVPAARTVLVTVDPASIALETATSWIAHTEPAPIDAVASEAVELAARYDGDDLASAASALGVTVDELVAAHLGATWRVAFTGFAPGFGYLVSDDWPYDVPRLASPRTRVPAGAIGLAGGYSGVYPRESPGGWRLIGTTDAELWNPAADPPARLVPGATVRFVRREAES
ncbi:5-oxoprolinase subunit B family protein [Agromyces mangrovi Wang et al. 2018]|uniref:5-oxoprolinase subunit B family protein n=1 Tax=Agromyces mangrovi TaxID=1858653 RepID=UPI00257462E9|nr:allophanate hydrolase subunit 1 [Agromyces mangrovi]BDZ63909.1 allophanate hydrolase [Agromyces mangrovi]